MSLKYVKRTHSIIFIILTILRSLEVVFIANITQQLFNWVNDKKISLINLIIVAVIGLIIFWIINLIYEWWYSRIIKEADYNIKSITTKYLIFSEKNTDFLDTSFFTNDLKQIEERYIAAELEIVTSAIQFLSAVIAALFGSIPLTIIFLLVSFIPGISQKFFGKIIEKKAENWEKKNSIYTERIKETEKTTQVFKLYDQENILWKRIKKVSNDLETSLQRLNFVRGTSNDTVSDLAYLFITVLPIAVGVYLVSVGNITFGTLIMVSQLSNNFINPLVNITMYLNDRRSSKPMWSKVIVATKLIEKQHSSKLSFKELNVKNASLKVGNKKLFSNLSFNIKSGEKVLIVAPSGWGKSTFLKALIGQVKINGGTYVIDNEELNGNFNKAHSYFSMINQEPKLLNDTILFNITLGKNISRNEINSAIDKAGLKDLIKERGLDYVINKSGENLSGGQKQRIEIARAIIFKRPIMLADEATSSLDERTSLNIHKLILLNKTATVIEVGHHISEEEKLLFNRVINLENIADKAI
ncbi:ABC transporter ATP-binding protein [Lactobacillus mulieris]|jgi:ABC transporter|uniref:ABC transporter ATP-binding protein/permease n=1 Tax=Lactobacillus mulieris TaxID=2508708 RepID=A0AAP3GW89_9LACO|nr:MULTISPECIES: ABC transporter ATP-binding protein [Lactobacillus]EEU20673.1 hypothetical protein HMPREF0525_01253 [Lactobacillus jensenii 27-2-CHN]EEX23792.1 ABC transporter, ATP-binding protein [Lactobacillus jensenii 115-3-CHN]EFH29929.1 ABC transporter, ATP-binding protein [Lactobacillus jensenii JV-V16]KAA9245568.1 ABC transporter ATP-binding protein [Lactobacillus jensenii]KAA9369069.1 ABC transporter ATP-binding protein [Lactobacillus jensenii]